MGSLAATTRLQRTSKYGLDDFLETNALPEDCDVFSKTTVNGPVVAQSPEEAAGMFATTGELMSRFLDIDGHGGRTVIHFPFNTTNSIRSNPTYLKIDEISIQDRVDQLKDLSQEERTLLEEHAASFYGIPPDQAAFSEVLHTYALCNFDPQMVEEATLKYKLSRGMTALALAILDDFRGDRLFSSPVKSITQTDGEYGAAVVLESGRKYHANVIVSTIPMNVVLSTHFDPPLSPLRISAFTDGIVATKIDKLLATTSADLPNGFHISCEGGDMPLSSGFADGVQDAQTILTLPARY